MSDEIPSRFGRRDFVKRAVGLGLTAPVIPAFLAACGTQSLPFRGGPTETPNYVAPGARGATSGSVQVGGGAAAAAAPASSAAAPSAASASTKATATVTPAETGNEPADWRLTREVIDGWIELPKFVPQYSPEAKRDFIQNVDIRAYLVGKNKAGGADFSKLKEIGFDKSGFINEPSKADQETYSFIYIQFGYFLKNGVMEDQFNQLNDAFVAWPSKRSPIVTRLTHSQPYDPDWNIIHGGGLFDIKDLEKLTTDLRSGMEPFPKAKGAAQETAIAPVHDNRGFSYNPVEIAAYEANKAAKSRQV